jgi:hypothetical protein
MSTCLEQLLADTPERKAQADAADAAQAKRAQAFSAAIRSQRFGNIRMLCREQASHMGSVSYPALCDLYEHAIRALCDELDTLGGRNATPQAGCIHAWCSLDSADVLVEFEHEPADGDGWNSPRYAESCTPINVLVNGNWISADEFDDDTRTAWAEKALEHLQAMRDDAAEARAEAMAEESL